MKPLSHIPVRVRAFREAVRSSFWLVPLTLALFAFCLAEYSVWLEDDLLSRSEFVKALWNGDQTLTSDILTTLAGSMINLTGVVFSLTMVALTLVSSQFGPRLLRQYMQDRSTQVTLGTFLGTFLFCVGVLRKLKSSSEESIPHLAVFLAIGLTVLSLCALVRFLQTLASSIQSPNLVANVAQELLKRIDNEFSQRTTDEKEFEPAELPTEKPTRIITAEEPGYLETLDTAALIRTAKKQKALFVVHLRPGHFVGPEEPLVSIYGDQEWTEDDCKSVQDAFAWSRSRSPIQDVEYHLRQLVEVGVRALSPSINDPNTAMNCIDWLSAGLVSLSKQKLPHPHSKDDDGETRVVMKRPLRFQGLVDTAFDQLRQYGCSCMAVRIHLVRGLARVADAVEGGRRESVLNQVRAVLDDEHVPVQKDLDDLKEVCLQLGLAEVWNARKPREKNSPLSAHGGLTPEVPGDNDRG